MHKSSMLIFVIISILNFHCKSSKCQSASLLQTYSRSLVIPDSCLNHLNRTIPVTDASANTDYWSLYSFGLINDKPNRANYGFGYCSNRNRYILPARGNVGPTNIGGSNAGYRNIGRDNLGPNNYGVANKGKYNCGNGNHGYLIEGNFLKGSEYAELSEVFTTAKFSDKTSILSIQTLENVQNKIVYFSFRMTDFFCPSDRFEFSLAQSKSINDKNISWTSLGKSSVPKSVLPKCDDTNFADTPDSAILELREYFSSYSSPTIRLNSNMGTFIKFDWIESDFSGGAAAFKWYLDVVELPQSCYLRRTKTVPITLSLVDVSTWGMFSWGSYTVQSQQNFGPIIGNNGQGGSLNLGTNNVGNKNIGYGNVGDSNAGAYNVGNNNCGIGNEGDGIIGNYLTTKYFIENSEDLKISGSDDETIFSLKLDSIQSNYEIEISLIDLFCPGDMFTVYYGFSVDTVNILLGSSTQVSMAKDCSAAIFIEDIYEALASPKFSQATFTVNVTSSLMQISPISTSAPTIYVRVKTTQNWGDGGIAGIKFSLSKGPLELTGCSLRHLKTAPLSPLKGDQKTWNNFVWGQYAKGSRLNWGPTAEIAPNSGQDNLGTRNEGNRNVGNDNVGDDNWGDFNRGSGNCGNGNVGDEIIGNYLTKLDFEMRSINLPEGSTFQSTVISAEVLESSSLSLSLSRASVTYWNYQFTIVDLYCPGDVYIIFWSDDETLKKWYKYGETSEILYSKNLTCSASDDGNYTSNPQIAMEKPDLFSRKSFYIKTEAKKIFLRVESKNKKFDGGAFSLKYSIDPVYLEPLKLPDSCAKLDIMTIPLQTNSENQWQIVPFGVYSTKDASDTKKNFLDYMSGSVNNTLTGNYGSNNVGHSNLGSLNRGSNNFGNHHVGDGNCGWNCTGTDIAGVSINSEDYSRLAQGRVRSKGGLSRMFALHFDESEWYTYYKINFQVQDILCGGDTFSAAFTSDPFKIPTQTMKASSKVKITQHCIPPYYTTDPDTARKLTTIYSQGTYSTYFWPTKKFSVLYFYLEAIPFKSKRYYTVTGGSLAVKFQMSLADLPYVLEMLQKQRLEQEMIEKKYQLRTE